MTGNNTNQWKIRLWNTNEFVRADIFDNSQVNVSTNKFLYETLLSLLPEGELLLDFYTYPYDWLDVHLNIFEKFFRSFANKKYKKAIQEECKKDEMDFLGESDNYLMYRFDKRDDLIKKYFKLDSGCGGYDVDGIIVPRNPIPLGIDIRKEINLPLFYGYLLFNKKLSKGEQEELKKQLDKFPFICISFEHVICFISKLFSREEFINRLNIIGQKYNIIPHIESFN